MTTPFATVTLIQGPETLLAERAVQAVISRAVEQHADATVNRVKAAELDRGTLAEITSGSLFSTSAVAVIEQLGDLPSELVDDLVSLAEAPDEDLALIVVHEGGMKGRGLLDRLRKAGVEIVEAPSVKTWELPQFVAAEVRQRGGRIDRATAEALVSAVGTDLRSVVAALTQLLSDTEEPVLTQADVHRYFAGRAKITGFAVADHCLNGNREAALASARWALDTAVAPVLLTSAVAASLRNLGKFLGARDERLRDVELARRIGVPPWKLKDLGRQARGWTAPALAEAIRAVALADAQVKGAAGDPEFALERMILRVIDCRERSRAPMPARS